MKSSTLTTYFPAIISVIGLSFATSSAQASDIDYVSWTAVTQSKGQTNGSVTGTLTLPQSAVDVTYSGDVAFFTQIDNIGHNYDSYSSIYTDSVVSNLPTNVDFVALSGSSTKTNTITFSAPVTNIILDIINLGTRDNAVSYTFDAAPTLLSQGYSYGDACTSCLSVTGDTLTGKQGDGVIEFVGTYSSLTFTTSGGSSDFFNGFTVGVVDSSNNSQGANATPEPGTWSGLLIAAFLSAPYLLGRKAAKK